MTGSDDVILHAFDSALESTRVSRYDLVLAVIPLAFVVALSASYVTATPLQSAMVAASGVSALAVVDALFLRPPGLSGKTGGA